MCLCCSWVTCFYNSKSSQVVSELACPIPLLPCFPLWGFGLGDAVDNHNFSPFPWCVLRESSFLCQLFVCWDKQCYWSCSISWTKTEVFVLCMFLQGWEPLSRWEVVGPERRWIHPLSFFFKRGKHMVSAPFAAWKISIFQSSMQDLRTKPFEKHCLQWDVP